MKILFIQPWDKSIIPNTNKLTRKKAYLSRTPFEVGYWVPLQHDFSVLDINLELILHKDWTLEMIVEDCLRHEHPDVVFLTFPTFAQGEHIARIVTTANRVFPKVRIVLGGANMAAIKNAPLRWGWSVEACYCGWGFEIPQLLEALEKKYKPIIPGVYWRGELEWSGINNWKRVLADEYDVENLYSIGGRINFFQMMRRYSEAGIEIMGALEMTRGCPMQCSFCAINNDRFGHYSRSPEVVINEARFLAQVGIRYLHIIDPTFGSFKQEANRLCEGLTQIYQEFSNMKFEILTRSEFVNDREASKLQKMGVARCGIGMETMSMEQLNSVHKHLKPNTTETAAITLAKYGIETKLFHILFPGVFSEATVSFAMRLYEQNMPFRIQSSLLRMPPTSQSEQSFLEQDQTIFIRKKDTLEQIKEWMIMNLLFPSMDVDVKDGSLLKKTQEALLGGKKLQELFDVKEDYVGLGNYRFEASDNRLIPMAMKTFQYGNETKK